MEGNDIQQPSSEDVAFAKNGLKLPELLEDEIRMDKIVELLNEVERPEDKLSLALLISGAKPACIIKMDSFALNLISMLRYPSHADSTYSLISVAKDSETLDRMLEIDKISDGNEHDRELGILLGYPETAVDAFVKHESMQLKDVPKEIDDSGISRFTNFVFSKDHWRDELEVLKGQIKSVKDVLPDLYESVNWEVIDEIK